MPEQNNTEATIPKEIDTFCSVTSEFYDSMVVLVIGQPSGPSDHTEFTEGDTAPKEECPICRQVHDINTHCSEVTCPCFRCGEVMPVTKQWLVKTMGTTPGWAGPFCEACKDIVLKEYEE